MTVRAVVVLVDDERARWLGECATHVSEQGYELAAVADAATALTMLADGRADVIVAGTGRHLPGVEFAAGPVRARRVDQPQARPGPESPIGEPAPRRRRAERLDRP